MQALKHVSAAKIDATIFSNDSYITLEVCFWIFMTTLSATSIQSLSAGFDAFICLTWNDANLVFCYYFWQLIVVNALELVVLRTSKKWTMHIKYLQSCSMVQFERTSTRNQSQTRKQFSYREWRQVKSRTTIDGWVVGPRQMLWATGGS